VCSQTGRTTPPRWTLAVKSGFWAANPGRVPRLWGGRQWRVYPAPFQHAQGHLAGRAGTVLSHGGQADQDGRSAGRLRLLPHGHARRRQLKRLPAAAHRPVRSKLFKELSLDWRPKQVRFTVGPARACGEIANAADVQRLMPFHFSRRYEDTPQRVYAEEASVCSRTLVPKQFWDRCDPRQLDGWLWCTRGTGSSATSATRRRCDTMASRRRTAMRRSAKSSLAFRLSST
jgi:hypothetical protein